MVTTVNVHFSFFYACNDTIGSLNFILTISLWRGDIPLSRLQFVVFIYLRSREFMIPNQNTRAKVGQPPEC